jgi:Tfp pilus assembly protein PilF
MTHLFPSIVGLLGVLGVLLAAYRIYPVFSFLGSIFFIILAPSSSIIPLKDLIFEYRVYLSLSVVAIGATYLIKIGVARWIHPKSQKAFFMTVIGVLVLLLGGITYQRNKIYLSEETVWLDVIAKRPMNARAYNNLGEYYLRQGKNTEAKANFSKSISLNTSYADVFANMATVLGKEGKLEDAITFAKAAIEIQPDFAIGYNNLGSVLNQLGRYAEAVPYFEKTLKLGFYEEGVLQNLGVALANSGHPRRAILVLREALRINPSSVESKNVLDQIQTSLEKNPAP